MENPAIKNGVFMGVASILFTMLFYFIDASMAVGLLNSLLVASIVSIAFMYLAAVGERANNGGFMSFGEGLKASFLAAIIGGLISQLFFYLFINFVDPSLVDAIRENALAWFDWIASFAGEGDEALEEARELIEEQNYTPTFSATLINYLVSLIFPSFIFALIIAAITKKEDKSFA